MLTEIKLRPQKTIAAFAITRTDLASYLGTTFETISRQIHYLEDHGVIHIMDSNHFEIVDRGMLQTIAGVSNEDLRLFMPTSVERPPPRDHRASVA